MQQQQPCAIASCTRNTFSCPSRGYFHPACGSLTHTLVPALSYTTDALALQTLVELLSPPLFVLRPGLEGSFGLMIPMSAARGHSTRHRRAASVGRSPAVLAPFYDGALLPRRRSRLLRRDPEIFGPAIARPSFLKRYPFHPILIRFSSQHSPEMLR